MRINCVVAQMRIQSCGVAIDSPGTAIDPVMAVCTLAYYAPPLDSNPHTIELAYSREGERAGWLVDLSVKGGGAL